MYGTPIRKDPNAQVDLLRTMMEKSKEWRNHNDRRMDKLYVGPNYIFLYKSNELWRIEEHVWCACVRKINIKKVDKLWIIPT
jgi:hypothetical protein